MKLLENIVYVLRKSFRREERRKRKTEGACIKKAEGKGGGIQRKTNAVSWWQWPSAACLCVSVRVLDYA